MVRTFSNDLIKQVQSADKDGANHIVIHVPKFDSKDNFPFAVYLGSNGGLSHSLYLQGIISKEIDIEFIPDHTRDLKYYTGN